jgi:hypothetical protein
MIRPCFKWPVLVGLFAWSIRAMAQDPAPVPTAIAPLLDPTSAMVVGLLDSGGIPLVAAWVAYQVSRGLSGFTPTLRIIHHKAEAEWDGVDRRRSDSDR